MSILVVGLSHHSAPVRVLEQVALTDQQRDSLAVRLLTTEHVGEAMVVATCNRVEIYAAVAAFHPALDDVASMLSDYTGMPVAELSNHLYVKYGQSAAEHLFSVASGLDSMVVGEQQIIGQIRSAYNAARDGVTAGPVLHRLAQKALHVGKRVHTETGIDSAGASVVSVTLDRAARIIAGPKPTASDGIPSPQDASPMLTGRRAVVLGAGAMGGLAVAHLARAGVAHIDVTNRTPQRAERLAEIAQDAGTPAQAVLIDDLDLTIARADLVFVCTGAIGTMVSLADVHKALAVRAPGRGLVICDLGMPRDVDPAVGRLPGVTVLDIEVMADAVAASPASTDADAARLIVEQELSDYVSAERVAEVGPMVAELRERAGTVVESEMVRLQSRLPDLDQQSLAEVAKTVQRVVDKVLHSPTVKFKKLAATPNGDSYADVLRELFDLSGAAGDAAARPLAVSAELPGAGPIQAEDHGSQGELS